MINIETLIAEYPCLWAELRSMPIDKLGVLTGLLNGESYEPVGRDTATRSSDKEDALISALRVDWLIPISSERTGEGNKVRHVMNTSDRERFLSDRPKQREELNIIETNRKRKRSEQDIERAIQRFGEDWVLTRVQMPRRTLKKSPDAVKQQD